MRPPCASDRGLLGFTANDCLDFGIDLGSPVGIEYYDLAPFKFNGRIEQARVEYTDLGPPVRGLPDE